MASYHYKGVDAHGARVGGTLDAQSPTQAMADLGRRGYQVFDLVQAPRREATPGAGAVHFAWLRNRRAKVTQSELLVSVQELATLLEAGVPLADGVQDLARGHAGQSIGDVLDGIYANLRAGTGFARALAQSSMVLPAYVHELVSAGEQTGQLAQSLRSAAGQLEADARFHQEARNALTYPLLLVASGLVATLVVFVFVVPKFANILSNPKADLPWMSRWVLQSGLWLVGNKLLAFGTASIAAMAAALASRQASVRTRLWEAASGAPLLGRWIQHVEISRWASMLAVLLEHHVPLLEALAHARNSLTGSQSRRKADLIVGDVRSGRSLADAMQGHHFVDAIGINLVRVGERSGALPRTVASLASLHRSTSEQNLKRFLVLLEPLTILMVSVLLGGIMISVMVAITSLTNVI